MNNTIPCQYLSHVYDQAELHDFALYCMKKYDQQFYGKLTKLTWTNLSDPADQQKLKTILTDLFDMFETIGQPFNYKNPRIFYSNPFGYGAIHKDPVYSKNNTFELSKWAVNIPAVNSDLVDLEFFDDFSDINSSTRVKSKNNEKKLPYCIPEFYNKHFEQYKEHPFNIGSLPEEQTESFYKKSFTNTMILDTTVWHRSRSYTNQLSVRFQYQSYVDCQKSYNETVDQLKNNVSSRHLVDMGRVELPLDSV